MNDVQRQSLEDAAKNVAKVLSGDHNIDHHWRGAARSLLYAAQYLPERQVLEDSIASIAQRLRPRAVVAGLPQFPPESAS